MNQRGFFLPIIVLVVVIGSVGVFFAKNEIQKKTQVEVPASTPSPSLTPASTLAPTPTPSPTQTPTPTLSPSPLPTVLVTTKPTQVPVSGPPGSGYSSITVATEKGNFSVRVLSIDLNSARMITDTGNEGDCGNDCTVMPLSDFVARNGGFAGINGTYFCPVDYAECASKKNSFDFPVFNSRVGRWINGGNLGWNSRTMVYFDGGGAHYLQNASSFGGGLTAGIVNFPGLLSGGVVQIDDNQSGLSDKQKAKGTKVGIGVRGSKNIMIVIASSATMQDFAYIFKALGADGALNLDDGGSTALYYNGKYLAGPGRALPNAIIFAR